MANRTWLTHGWLDAQVLAVLFVATVLAAVVVGAVSRRQMPPPSEVPSSATHRLLPQPTVPSAKPCWVETNVIERTWKPGTRSLVTAGDADGAADTDATGAPGDGVPGADDAELMGPQPARAKAAIKATPDAALTGPHTERGMESFITVTSRQVS